MLKPCLGAVAALSLAASAALAAEGEIRAAVLRVDVDAPPPASRLDLAPEAASDSPPRGRRGHRPNLAIDENCHLSLRDDSKEPRTFQPVKPTRRFGILCTMSRQHHRHNRCAGTCGRVCFIGLMDIINCFVQCMYRSPTYTRANAYHWHAPQVYGSLQGWDIERIIPRNPSQIRCQPAYTIYHIDRSNHTSLEYGL